MCGMGEFLITNPLRAEREQEGSSARNVLPSFLEGENV